MSQPSTDPKQAKHVWRFFRAGGFDQVCIDAGDDLLALNQLDQKLWVALSCPTRGLEFDSKTLDLIDTDKDGRIRVPEILAAVRWACAMLKNPDDLLKSSPALPLDAINDATPEGKHLLSSARQIVQNLGKKNTSEVTVEDTTDTTKIFAQTNFNGDGIIPIDSAEDPAVKAVIQDIIACLGSDIDRSTKPGISQVKVDLFFKEATAYADWWNKAEGDNAVLPLGPATLSAAAAVKAVKAKVDDYFARCRLAAYDPRAQAALNRQESEYLLIAAKDLTITAIEVASFPLARIEANKPLPLSGPVNPAWAAALAKLQSEAIKPLLGEKQNLTEADWSALNAKFTAFDAWQSAKTGALVEKLGIKRVREILSSNARSTIAELIARDKALEPESNAIAAVDRLVRYYRDLYRLLNNFVNFREFYSRQNRAAFQCGTLYLDQRSCDLCVKVDDVNKHAAVAHLSRTYLAYCELVRKSTNEKMTIAAAVTSGDSDNLMVGRNGLFYDRKGNDWDATIVKVIDHPISIRQAFWAPYKRAMRWIEDQIVKRAAAADTAGTDVITGAFNEATTAATTGKAPTQKPKIDIGVVAALGVAVGGITAAVGMVLKAFFDLGMWMPLGFAGIMLLISGPSMTIAWLKLRQRNLGPILDANGWAVNAKAKINIPFGGSLTRMAALPKNAKRDLTDPYADHRTGLVQLACLAILLIGAWALWNFGVIEKFAPNVVPKSEWVKAREAAAAATAKGTPTTQPTPAATPVLLPTTQPSATTQPAFPTASLPKH